MLLDKTPYMDSNRRLEIWGMTDQQVIDEVVGE